MGSTFNGLALFDSGPHRFAEGPIGELVVSNLSLGSNAAGSVALGPLEPVVIVTGRLVADKESDLWTLRDDISAQLTDPPQVGDLVDHYGHVWTDMAFIRFEPDGRTDRARWVSLRYTARFMRFLSP